MGPESVIEQLVGLVEAAEAAPPHLKEDKQRAAAEIGSLVSNLRSSAGLSVERLSKLADINAAALYRLERGAKLCSFPGLHRMIDALRRSDGSSGI